MEIIEDIFEGIDKVINWIAPYFFCFIVGVAFGYIWCYYQYH